MYRILHETARGEKSKGERNEIRAAAAAAADAKAKRDAKYLDQIMKDNPRYTEMNDIADLVVDDTYVEYQGADMDQPLLPLGKFIKIVNGPHALGRTPITLKFQEKELEGYFRTASANVDRLWVANKTSIKGKIFKVNTDAKEDDGEDK